MKHKTTPETPPTKKQVVAGFIIYRRTHEGIKFLLLYRRGTYWNFPKGHFKPTERSLEAALREVEEETGLRRSDLRIVPGFRTYEKYYFRIGKQGIYDIVILYLAETHKSEIRISPREHSGFGWFLYHDALKTLGSKYVETKKALKQANDFLHRKGARSRAGHQSR